MEKKIKKGDIVLVDLPTPTDSDSSVQYGVRVCLVVQNDKGNEASTTCIIMPLTAQYNKKSLPTHVNIKKSEANNLEKDSTFMAEQPFTISEKQIIKTTGRLESFYDYRIDKAIMVSFGLGGRR